MKRYPLPLLDFKFFPSVNIEQQECCVNFWDFSGFVWTFLCINWVFNAFMCIIQIWTTSHAPVHINWLENQICVLGCMLRSHARNGNEFQTPGHRWLPAKHWDAWFLNSSKSKTRLKFMKLGMLSWSGINMPWYKFCPIWGRFVYMLLTNRSFSQQAWWFLVGNVPPLGTKRYPLPLIAFKNFLVST